MKYTTFIALLVFISSFITGTAQNKPDNVCYVSNGTIYFQLDRRWPDAKQKEFAALFSLDTLLIRKALVASGKLVHDSITWQVTPLSESIVELSRPLNTTPSPELLNDVILRDDGMEKWPQPDSPPPPHPSGNGEKIGINKFRKEQAFTFVDGIARFYLSGHRKSGAVYLSGTFNNWSTMQLPMTHTDKGWVVSIPMKPGRYLYKYIIDGRWTSDPDNLLKEPDGHSGKNSIVYCNNHTFELPGHAGARRVFVAGSFNNWQTGQISMKRYKNGWYLPAYLGNGTHFYKYIVDGQWITDPLNKNIKPDAQGNMNSFIGIGDTVMFRLNGYETARMVILTGNFNNWSHNELTMNKTAAGWELPYVLGPGNYEYKFIVDGTWIPDPDNPCTIGSGDLINSCFTFGANTTFTLPGFNEAKKVIVTGSFNNWNPKTYEMQKANGHWQHTLYLPPGKHTYKFIVDGAWLLDPTNPTWEDNAQGTGNSVIWVE